MDDRTQTHEIEAWLGPALDDMTGQQVEALRRESDDLDRSEQDAATQALIQAYERLVGV
ncbi:MAG: hypothetical protein Q8Q29_03790 [Actinomycetota bacterium]|nr:hypothetical protein [Actinomycetota bacterium]